MTCRAGCRRDQWADMHLNFALLRRIMLTQVSLRMIEAMEVQEEAQCVLEAQNQEFSRLVAEHALLVAKAKSPD